MQDDDVGAVLEDLKGLDFSEGGLVIVDFFEGDDDGVGAAAGSVYVGVRAGADTLRDFVL